MALGQSDDRRPVRVFFCSKCGEMLGVEDHIRIRHEHFEEGWPDPGRCRGGRYEIVEYAPTGRDLPTLDRQRQAIYSSGFTDGYKRGRDDEKHDREPPWSVREETTGAR